MGVSGDGRAVSESAGVATLVVITVVATASVGLSVVIFADDGDGTGFSVEFQYSSDLAQLTVFYNGDGEVRAGDIVVDGPGNNVTWAELADVPPDEPVAPGSRPVFLNKAGPYGNDVGGNDVIRVVHAPPDGETTTAVWNEQDGSGSEGDSTPDDPFSALGVAP
jgi:hypothetical protein